MLKLYSPEDGGRLLVSPSLCPWYISPQAALLQVLGLSDSSIACQSSSFLCKLGSFCCLHPECYQALLPVRSHIFPLSFLLPRAQLFYTAPIRAHKKAEASFCGPLLVLWLGITSQRIQWGGYELYTVSLAGQTLRPNGFPRILGSSQKDFSFQFQVGWGRWASYCLSLPCMLIMVLVHAYASSLYTSVQGWLAPRQAQWSGFLGTDTFTGSFGTLQRQVYL